MSGQALLDELAADTPEQRRRRRTLTIGAEGRDVYELRLMLRAMQRGPALWDTAPPGQGNMSVYTSQLDEAVRQLQRDAEGAAGPVDGACGPATYAYLARFGRTTTAAPAAAAADPLHVRDISASLPRHKTKRYRSRPLAGIDAVIVHHEATPVRKDGNWPAALRQDALYQISKHGWPGIAYHLAVAPDGDVLQCKPLSELGYHCPNWNTRGVGVVLLGNFMKKPPPAAQIEGLRQALHWLKQQLPGLRLLFGHREKRTTECPGAALPATLLDELATSASLARQG